MLHFYERYQQGHHQEVYDALLAMHDRVHEPSLNEDASAVMRPMMQRVRVNIETILQRLPDIGYVHHKGLSRTFTTQQEQEAYEKEMPLFQLPAQNVQEQIALLDHLAGSLPLSLRFFYQEVGSIHLVGAFSSMDPKDGYLLDPLCVFSLDIALIQVTMSGESWKEDSRLLLSGDCFFKYGYSGGGTYDVLLPCQAIDTLFVGEPHQLTFVNYLRLCILQWGGFPGLEQHPFVSQEQQRYLTQDLLPF
ncbi:hypothetical protein [Dictyobacter formicarum]|uniref:Knr4/Smi1-like domain-containing protein n=1 Tax=Dictyobacter formicarum TaxID=2778368 RepID=A0ABQ3VS95_9CHLR|nr:hypothetical protein [Dictyobacter formicarum]GHO89162.1 hypothetical protein KSZ_71680 [Dictyobacter formicarum]